jgi:hypothetical protein
MTLRIAAIFLLAALATPHAARPQRSAASAQDPSPDIAHTPAGLTEIGTLNAVPYRIDIPAAWNHKLIVYFHGYSETPYTYRIGSLLNEQVAPLFERGYAIIESGYSASGWALAEAYPETEQLRLYFLKKYAQPALGKSAKKIEKNPESIETIAAGGSMGGALVAAVLELNPKPYAGGLNLCGSVGPTDLAFQRRFAWRAAFDFYFPNLLPPIDPVPADYEETRTLRVRVEQALNDNPAGALAMRNLTWLHSNHDLALAMVYFTFVIGDIQHRAHGNAFDNRNFIYTGTDPSNTYSDNLLNDNVRRYAADPHAREYLVHHYTPTGQLHRPMVALHTVYDPRIPANTLTVYAEQVAVAGYSENLVQQFVNRDGHCTFTEDEIGRTFDELTAWIDQHRRPAPGLLPPAKPAPITNSQHESGKP